MAMGAADVVPGVSGGTIALLTGIYERLINAIKSFGLDTLKVLKQQGIKAAWQQFDGTFLAVLLAGMITSILGLAQVIHYLLNTFPVFIWSLFFGLVLASAVYVLLQVQWRTPPRLILLVLGIVFAAGISLMTPTPSQASPILFFFSGAIAISAMILPGISGSFILLLIGMYGLVISAVKQFDVGIMAVFALGCLVGIMLFSRFLSWLLARFHDATMVVLSGFMLGALVKLWPWREILSTRVNSQGQTVPVSEWPVAPWQVESPQVMAAVFAFFLGFVGVLYLAKRQKTAKIEQ
ncbi:DUF368 domain-containing protein [Bermanella marisrubri]|uniref:Integral membrane protein n=2 Tax=Bermanella marisrubri TaxID=207949 RepID=Q1N1K2_9GAMM|nr:hypothetical protein RED65_03380 [Oceanobacter sp. RED65] [Bermanella marisrubri]QIZ85761.1 DUF368 domain-containing protein [Bermanella marisrubri]